MSSRLHSTEALLSGKEPSVRTDQEFGLFGVQKEISLLPGIKWLIPGFPYFMARHSEFAIRSGMRILQLFINGSISYLGKFMESFCNKVFHEVWYIYLTFLSIWFINFMQLCDFSKEHDTG